MFLNFKINKLISAVLVACLTIGIEKTEAESLKSLASSGISKKLVNESKFIEECDNETSESETLIDGMYDELIWQDGIQYGLVNEDELATVYSCIEDAENVTIPATISYGNVAYTIATDK